MGHEGRPIGEKGLREACWDPSTGLLIPACRPPGPSEMKEIHCWRSRPFVADAIMRMTLQDERVLLGEFVLGGEVRISGQGTSGGRLRPSPGLPLQLWYGYLLSSGASNMLSIPVVRDEPIGAVVPALCGFFTNAMRDLVQADREEDRGRVQRVVQVLGRDLEESAQFLLRKMVVR